eukprot:Rmarinus@m.1813
MMIMMLTIFFLSCKSVSILHAAFAHLNEMKEEKQKTSFILPFFSICHCVLLCLFVFYKKYMYYIVRNAIIYLHCEINYMCVVMYPIVHVKDKSLPCEDIKYYTCPQFNNNQSNRNSNHSSLSKVEFLYYTSIIRGGIKAVP